MYTIALPGVAVQYALVDGLDRYGKGKYALPLSLFRKIVYAVCLGVLPLLWNIENIFYAGTISDIIGALFSLILFWGVIKLKTEKRVVFPKHN